MSTSLNSPRSLYLPRAATSLVMLAAACGPEKSDGMDTGSGTSTAATSDGSAETSDTDLPPGTVCMDAADYSPDIPECKEQFCLPPGPYTFEAVGNLECSGNPCEGWRFVGEQAFVGLSFAPEAPSDNSTQAFLAALEGVGVAAYFSGEDAAVPGYSVSVDHPQVQKLKIVDSRLIGSLPIRADRVEWNVMRQDANCEGTCFCWYTLPEQLVGTVELDLAVP